MVGYSSITVARGGYVMASPQFKDCNAVADVSDFNACVKVDATALDYADYDLPDFPAIWIKDGPTSSVYTKKFYYFWDSEEDDVPAGWWDRLENAPTASDALALGAGCWLVIPDDDTLYPKDAYTFTFNGAVADTTAPISIPVVNGGYIMTANPFPVPLQFSKITVSPGVPCLDYADYDLPDFPAIWIKNGDTSAAYDKKFYYFWDSDEEDVPAGWWNYMEEAQTSADYIPVGKAFWIVIPDGCLPDDNQTFTFAF